MILALEPLFVSVPSCASVSIWGDDDLDLGRESFSLSAEEAAPLEREVTSTAPEAKRGFVLTTWELVRRRQLVRKRQAQQARREQRPAIDLHLRSGSLIELLTSYFVLLGGGAKRGKAAESGLRQMLAFATRGILGPLVSWPPFRGFFLYSAYAPSKTSF